MGLSKVQRKTAATALAFVAVIVVIMLVRTIVTSDRGPDSDSASGPQLRPTIPPATSSVPSTTSASVPTATTDPVGATTPSIASDSSSPPQGSITSAASPQLSQTFGARDLLIVASAESAVPNEEYTLYFADSASLARGACHDVGVEAGGPTVSGSDGSIPNTVARVPRTASRGAGQLCFALKDNRAIHSDAAAFFVL